VKIGQSLVLIERHGQSSVLVDKKIYFFGGFSIHSSKPSGYLDQILYLDISKPFNIANPPFELVPNIIPFGSAYATALLDRQKKMIYLFGGVMVDVNTGNDSF